MKSPAVSADDCNRQSLPLTGRQNASLIVGNIARSPKNFAARRRTIYVATFTSLCAGGSVAATLHMARHRSASYRQWRFWPQSWRCSSASSRWSAFTAKKKTFFSLLGTGFIGTSFLDGYHARGFFSHVHPIFPLAPTLAYSLERFGLAHVPLCVVVAELGFLAKRIEDGTVRPACRNTASFSS